MFDFTDFNNFELIMLIFKPRLSPQEFCITVGPSLETLLKMILKDLYNTICIKAVIYQGAYHLFDAYFTSNQFLGVRV